MLNSVMKLDAQRLFQGCDSGPTIQKVVQTLFDKEGGDPVLFIIWSSSSYPSSQFRAHIGCTSQVLAGYGAPCGTGDGNIISLAS